MPINPTEVRLGRLPARHDVRTLHLSDYVDVTKLPRAPASFDGSTKVATWPMMLNNSLGCCTIAAAGHQIQAWTADAGAETDPVDAAILIAYEAVSGYDPTTGAHDDGAVELDVLRYWRTTGVGGHRIGAFASVSPTNHALVNTAIWLFGGVYIGLALPLAAQKMGTVWDRPANARGKQWVPGSWGGHAVIALSYNRATGRRKIITWGQVVEVTDAFWGHYVDEVWALISPDFLAGGKSPDGFDLATLNADLAGVGRIRSDPQPQGNPVPAPITRNWLLSTVEQAVIVFLTALVGAMLLSGAGAFNMPALRAAAVAGGAAVLSFLQSALAGLAKPGEANLLTAVRTRRA